MKFFKVKVKSSTEINIPNNEPSGRIESQTLSKPILWLLLILISMNTSFLLISQVILKNCQNQIKFELRLSIQTFDLFRSFNNLGSLLGASYYIFLSYGKGQPQKNNNIIFTN